MWGSVEMADIRCAFTYQAAQHCRNQQAEVLVHAGNTVAARARLRRRSGGGGGGGGGACDGETSGVGGVRVPEGSSQGSLKGSSTRSSSGTTVTRI